MIAFGVLGGIVVGIAFGYGAQRGAFCMSSGFRAALAGETTKLKALGLAAPGRAGSWDWRRTGIWVGIAAASAWPASALTGMALLAPSGFVIMAAIFAGSTLAELAARRLEGGLRLGDASGIAGLR